MSPYILDNSKMVQLPWHIPCERRTFDKISIMTLKKVQVPLWGSFIGTWRMPYVILIEGLVSVRAESYRAVLSDKGLRWQTIPVTRVRSAPWRRTRA